MKRFIFTVAVVTGTIIFSVNKSHAQDTIPKKWHYLADVYMMFPNMTGETTVANLPDVDVNANAGDILGNLKMGAMFYFEATNNNWAITSDLIYMKLGQDVAPGKLITAGDITMKQFAWELAGLKRVAPWFEAGLGGRLVNLYTGIDLKTISNPRSGSATKTWYDPIIIVRSNNVIHEKWLAQLRVDCGGFGIGSDFTWQAQANVGYRFSNLFQTTIGYRYIGIDYDKGEGIDRFYYNIDTYGWVVHFGFNF
jgi:hypothetical protein